MKTPNNGYIVDFTREPIIETIITPKEGCKLVVKSSKNSGLEEYFVEAVEVVTFGQASFFRSLERPKPFLVPVCDYELVEVREARMVLKSVGIDRSIKIGGGRENAPRLPRNNEKEAPSSEVSVAKVEVSSPVTSEATTSENTTEERPAVEKKRDRRRQYRKRRGQTTDKAEETAQETPIIENEETPVLPTDEKNENIELTTTSFSSLLQPPPTLISETINRYRENALFKSAFFLNEEDEYKPHDKVQALLDEDDSEENALLHTEAEEHNQTSQQGENVEQATHHKQNSESDHSMKASSDQEESDEADSHSKFSPEDHHQHENSDEESHSRKKLAKDAQEQRDSAEETNDHEDFVENHPKQKNSDEENNNHQLSAEDGYEQEKFNKEQSAQEIPIADNHAQENNNKEDHAREKSTEDYHKKDGSVQKDAESFSDQSIEKHQENSQDSHEQSAATEQASEPIPASEFIAERASEALHYQKEHASDNNENTHVGHSTMVEPQIFLQNDAAIVYELYEQHFQDEKTDEQKNEPHKEDAESSSGNVKQDNYSHPKFVQSDLFGESTQDTQTNLNNEDQKETEKKESKDDSQEDDEQTSPSEVIEGSNSEEDKKNHQEERKE